MSRHTSLRGTSRSGRIWRLSALVAIGAIAATTLSPTPTTVSADAGVVSPSWVQVLDYDDSGNINPVPLSSVRHAALHGFYKADGTGIDVALIDTGVAPVDGLNDGQVLHGPDLSDEGSSRHIAYLDTYGHGTHMAGIIAGDRAGHEGVAPGARIVSVKVAGRDGITTVPQVVAAIDWVVEHRNSDGLNIRVLNLSLGQSDVSSHIGDELSMAVERAWHAGIFVVVAAGNDGDDQPHLDSPAIDPYVMAVGASDTHSDHRRGKRSVPAWSAQGDGFRNPDVVAPGRSIASYRVPGSTADEDFDEARLPGDLFAGSGSSQAAATVSGAAAVVLSKYPELQPDDLKASFKVGTSRLWRESSLKSGNGLISVKRAIRSRHYDLQTHTLATGQPFGSGEVGPSGSTWSGGHWSGGHWNGAKWSGAKWSGGHWSGNHWSGTTWSGAHWSGATWSGGHWSGAHWSGGHWSGNHWSGAHWSGHGWVDGDD